MKWLGVIAFAVFLLAWNANRFGSVGDAAIGLLGTLVIALAVSAFVLVLRLLVRPYWYMILSALADRGPRKPE